LRVSKIGEGITEYIGMLFTYALTIAQLVKNACTPRVKLNR
jgi:hypothetical protein